jgi:NagD protein
MIGDRLYTDMKLAENAGIKSILVLSGETTRDDVQNADIQIDLIVSSLKYLAPPYVV